MRRYTLAAVTAVTLLSIPTFAPEVQAFGDTCFRDLAARGGVANTMRGARAAAQSAWETAASRRHGARFADWWYSGERTFDCSWDTSGRRISCIARAIPCGRKR